MTFVAVWCDLADIGRRGGEHVTRIQDANRAFLEDLKGREIEGGGLLKGFSLS